MKTILGFFTAMACVAFLAWFGTRIYYSVEFDMNCENYISQAASSPDPKISAAKLDVAISYAEKNGLTSGNTSVLFTYPTNDIGFWYRRIVDSRAILRALPENDAPLEISNTMMRVRETLVSGGKDGEHIVAPGGIEIAPYNVAFAWWGWVSFLLGCVFCGSLIVVCVND